MGLRMVRMGGWGWGCRAKLSWSSGGGGGDMVMVVGIKEAFGFFYRFHIFRYTPIKDEGQFHPRLGVFYI